MTWRRREDGGENPAWPGLVDIFAFTMVFIMLLWLGTDWPQKVRDLETENQTLRAEKGTLEKRLSDLEHGGLKKLSD
ncbi:MAG: hypothetical protein KKD99_01595, partial [Proteobacteria bacterium]|nr:hypothetical protein [Pseudomonadota bacterium]